MTDYQAVILRPGNTDPTVERIDRHDLAEVLEGDPQEVCHPAWNRIGVVCLIGEDQRGDPGRANAVLPGLYRCFCGGAHREIKPIFGPILWLATTPRGLEFANLAGEPLLEIKQIAEALPKVIPLPDVPQAILEAFEDVVRRAFDPDYESPEDTDREDEE